MSRFFTSLLLVLAASCPAVLLKAAVVPYTENFETSTVGSTAPTGFTETPDSAWSVQNTSPIAGSQSYNGVVAGILSTTVAIGSYVDFTGSLGGSAATAADFSMSALLRPNTGTLTGSGSVWLGMGALASADSQNGYFFRTSTSGIVNIVEVNGGSSAIRFTLDQGGITLNSTYTFAVTGTYSDSNADLINDQLTLAFTITGDGMSGSTVTWTDTSPISAHASFGFRHYTTSSSGTVRNINIDQDNLNIAAVPEPSAVTMLFGGLGILLACRGRRSSSL